MDFTPFDPEAETEHWDRHLPHWEQAGCTYFVTFRLADSIPIDKLDTWRKDKARWLAAHPKPWHEDERKFHQEQFVERIERWTDLGSGACELRQPSLREIVSGSLEYFASKSVQSHDIRYDLFDCVVMPNHVHLLVKPYSGWSLGQLVHSWKSFSAKQINRKTGRSGSLWMDERFDHLVRNEESLQRIKEYIAENPRRAGLLECEFTLRRFDG